MRTKKYKEMWVDKYEELLNEGELSDIECQESADDYVSAYMFEKADYERKRRQEEQCNEDD